jgi:hypothetical protein
MGPTDSTAVQPPPRRRQHRRHAAEPHHLIAHGGAVEHRVGQRREAIHAVGLRSLPGGGVGLVTCATRTRLMGCAHSPAGVSAWSHARPELDLWVALTPRRGCRLGHMRDQNSTYGLRSLPGGVGLVAMEPYWLSSSGASSATYNVVKSGRAVTPGSRIGYTDNTGCHQLNRVVTAQNNVSEN